MRCVSADGTPSISGLVFRLTIPSSWPALLGIPSACVLRVMKEALTRSPGAPAIPA